MIDFFNFESAKDPLHLLGDTKDIPFLKVVGMETERGSESAICSNVNKT